MSNGKFAIVERWQGLWEWVKGHAVLTSSLALALFVSLVLVVGSATAFSVTVDGRQVAVVDDYRLIEAALRSLVDGKSRECGMDVDLDEEVAVKLIWAGWSERADRLELQRALAKALSYNTRTVAIEVDGQPVVFLASRADAMRVLEKLKSFYGNIPGGKVAFKEKVELVEVVVETEKISDVKTALEIVTSGGKEVRRYVVKEGDTCWDIASAAGVPVDKILAANPGLNPERLQPGEEILLAQKSPLINVLVSYKKTVREEIPYRTEERMDDSLFRGEQKVVQPGRAGEREVTYLITCQNGMETGRELLEEKVLREPVPRIVAKGKRLLLASRSGSGRLAWPTVGGIISPFGDRGGRFHAGVDIGGGYGAPVVAAEAGVVIHSGYCGGYGLCVDISHGGGVVTRYAHLSSCVVQPGQRVERGQFIGRVGATGNATGPHLHFEVLVNGSPKNPVLFL